MSKSKKIEKPKLRYEDLRKLENTFKDLDGDKMIVGLNLIDELYFMGKTLSGLKEIVSRDGVIENFKNGSQEMMREHPALKTYNTLIKNFNSTIKQLNDLLPDDTNTKDGDKIAKWLARSDD